MGAGSSSGKCCHGPSRSCRLCFSRTRMGRVLPPASTGCGCIRLDRRSDVAVTGDRHHSFPDRENCATQTGVFGKLASLCHCGRNHRCRPVDRPFLWHATCRDRHGRNIGRDHPAFFHAHLAGLGAGATDEARCRGAGFGLRRHCAARGFSRRTRHDRFCHRLHRLCRRLHLRGLRQQLCQQVSQRRGFMGNYHRLIHDRWYHDAATAAGSSDLAFPRRSTTYTCSSRPSS